MELVIGPQLYSTWSLRPWLVLRRAGADFQLTHVEYGTPAQKARLREVSPTGLVPLLKVDGETLWDSLAISEWAAEHFPEAGLWPARPEVRALARCVTAEMHSGFTALRNLCGTGPDFPLGGVACGQAPDDPALNRELARLVQLWSDMRGRFAADGPWLFGQWSIADAFYTPVAARVLLYQIDLAAHGDTDGVARAYVEALLQQPDYQDWVEAARSGRPDPMKTES